LDYWLELEEYYPGVDPEENDYHPNNKIRTLIDALKYLKDKKKTLSINFLHKTAATEFMKHKQDFDKLYNRDFPNRKSAKDPTRELLYWVSPLQRQMSNEGYKLSWKGGAHIVDCFSVSEKDEIDPECEKFVDNKKESNRDMRVRTDMAPPLLSILVMDPYFVAKGKEFVVLSTHSSL